MRIFIYMNLFLQKHINKRYISNYILVHFIKQIKFLKTKKKQRNKLKLI